MKIILLGAMKEEVSLLRSHLEDVVEEGRALYTYSRGFYKDHEIIIAHTGIGKVNAALCTQRLIDLHRPDLVIMVGVAGAIADLKIGDVVLATKVAHHDLDYVFLEKHAPHIDPVQRGYFHADADLMQNVIHGIASKSYGFKVYSGPMVSGEQFIDQEGRKEIIERFDPLTVDMETAGLAHACYRSQIPFLAIRSITDTEEESGDDAFERNYKEARENAQEFVLDVLEIF